MDKKINRAINCYPLLHGMYADLLFYAAIDTLFLSTVKGFSAAQIVLLTTISLWVAIALRLPLMWLTKKIGNTASVRGGAICMLTSALLITFGPSFGIVLLGRCLRLVAQFTNEVSAVVTLENNLEYSGRSEEFIPLRAKGSICYSTNTLVISLFATALFQINAYLPMYLCIACAAIGIVLAFICRDFSPYDRPLQEQKKSKTKVRSLPFVALTFVLYGIFYSFAMPAISDCKLFIQEVLLKDLSLQKTATIIGVIVFLSRICRLFGNITYTKIYGKFKLKTGFLPIIMFSTGFALLAFGSFIPQMPLKVAALGIAYLITMLAIDPFRYFATQIFVLFTPREEHQTYFGYMSIIKALGSALLSICASALLMKYTMISEMVLFLCVSVVALIIMWILYRILTKLKNTNNIKIT